MILKTSIGYLWQIKAVLILLHLWRLSGDQWKRLTIVGEEWFTNCVKHGGKPKCWIRVQRYRDFSVISFIDNGCVFDPFVENKDAVGLRLMTKLLKTKYRRLNGRNILEVCLSKN